MPHFVLECAIAFLELQKVLCSIWMIWDNKESETNCIVLTAKEINLEGHKRTGLIYIEVAHFNSKYSDVSISHVLLAHE